MIATTIVHLIHHPHRETIIPQFYLWLIRLEHLFPWLADIVIHHARVAFADGEQHLGK